MNYDDKMMRSGDKEKKCIELSCGQMFVFSVGERQFFKENGLNYEPNRCPDCRRRRRLEKERLEREALGLE